VVTGETHLSIEPNTVAIRRGSNESAKIETNPKRDGRAPDLVSKKQPTKEDPVSVTQSSLEKQLLKEQVTLRNREARSIAEKGDLFAAVAKYDEAIAVSGNFDSFFEKGKLLRRLGWIDEANQALGEAGAFVTQVKDPNKAAAWAIEYGQAKLVAKEYNVAITVFTTGLTQLGMSQNAKLWFNKGVAQTEFAMNQQFSTRERRQEDLEKALDSFDRALQLKPDYAEARREREMAFELLGGLNRQVQEREKAQRQLELNEKALRSLTENITRHESEVAKKKNATSRIEKGISSLRRSLAVDKPAKVTLRDISNIELELKDKAITDEDRARLEAVKSDKLATVDRMKVEIINRNEEGFNHFLLIPTIEVIQEQQYNIQQDEDYWELSIGITFLNISIWIVWEQ
jgi:tetratricopeptide (TPR) repeat protein